jgi:hypothetical protein
MGRRENAFRELAVVGTVFLGMSLWAEVGHAKYGGGSGTAQDPYQIWTPAQMDTIGTEPNDWDRHFRLMADLDLKDLPGGAFRLIGNITRSFTGVFDGGGHTVANFGYAVTGTEETTHYGFALSFGLFRFIDDPNAVVKDLGLLNVDIRPAATCPMRVYGVGALVGSLKSGSVRNCHVRGGRVQAERYVGALAGYNYGHISNCRAACPVGPAEQRSMEEIPGSMDPQCFGGLVGYSEGEISDCYATGAIAGARDVGGLVGQIWGGVISNSWSAGDVSGDRSIGGLIGRGQAGKVSHCRAQAHVSGKIGNAGGLMGSNAKACSITDCFAIGDVWAEQGAGGLVGNHAGSISRCYATASVRVDSWNAGGLVGLNGGLISASWAGGSVAGGSRAGGLIGTNQREMSYLFYDPIVTDSYATGPVRGTMTVGGLIGGNDGGAVHRCYSIGKVTRLTNDGFVGGLVGTNDVPMEDSFWDIETSGQAVSDGGQGRTTNKMQIMLTYAGVGWDFVGETVNGTGDIWKMGGRPIYPRLSWEPTLLPGDFLDPEGVGLEDLMFLAQHWLGTASYPCDGPSLTFDVRVDEKDLAVLAQSWRRGARKVIFETKLDARPAWTADGQWQFGRPGGRGGTQAGQPDPIGGTTGDNVFGVNLDGDYARAVDGPHRLTAGPFDCRGYHDVKLQFARWLNTDEADYVKATLETSLDGITWIVLWEHKDTEAMLVDEVWQTVVYALGPMADHQESVYVRWSYEVIDPQAWPMSGWNIDDVVLTGVED